MTKKLTIAQAKKAHDEAIAQAEKAYIEAKAKAWRVYLKAIEQGDGGVKNESK